MSNLKLAKAEKIDLKSHPEFNEKWLQQIISLVEVVKALYAMDFAGAIGKITTRCYILFSGPV